MKLPVFDHFPAAIAIDLDGTLWNSGTQLSGRSGAALEEVLDAGMPIIIATSRSARFDRLFPGRLTERCSFVLLNGAVAKAAAPLSGYFREAIPDEVSLDVVNSILAFDAGAQLTLEVDGYYFGANWNVDYSLLAKQSAVTPDKVLSVDEALARGLCKILVSANNVEALASILNERFDGKISVLPAKIGTPTLNVTGSGTSKESAVRRLLKHHCDSLDNVMAFGDDFQDIGMLQECGISVAMGNAFPEVKSVGKYCTASADDDGVAVVLEKMLKEVGG